MGGNGVPIVEKHALNRWKSDKLFVPGFAGVLNSTVTAGQGRSFVRRLDSDAGSGEEEYLHEIGVR